MPCPDEVARLFCNELADFLDGLVSHYVLDDGKLVVAHAGMKEEMQGRGSGRVRDFALYGETTGETDEFGLPVRFDWAAEYRGQAMVVYGHTPVPEPEWLNRTVNIDTGCVFGGRLTALRYPEKEFVSVPAARTYCEPARPFLPAEQQAPALLGAAGARRGARRRGRDGQADRPDPAAGQRDDPGGERHGGPGGDEPVRRRSEVADLPAAHHVAVRDQRRAGAAGTPRRGVRLLPQRGRPAGRLRGKAHGLPGGRHRLPRRAGGARAVRRRRGRAGIVYTRTGRRFFNDADLERRFLDRVRAALSAAGLWASWRRLGVPGLRTDAVVGQGPGTPANPVCGGRGGGVGLAPRAVGPSSGPVGWRARSGRSSPDRGAYRGREQDVEQFVAAYRQYCWPVESLADLGWPRFTCWPPRGTSTRTGPPLAHGDAGRGLPGRPRAAAGDPVPGRGRDRPGKPGGGDRLVGRADRRGAAKGWWSSRWRSSTGAAGACPARREVPGPGVPADHLRPRVHTEANLARLRSRGLGRKRSLALGEFALGVEGLERFVRREPLRRVHECVFGVLALESEPVDPRL